MRAIRVAETGPSRVLQHLADLPTPPIAPGHVRVRNAYAGVNFIDIYQRTGQYPLPLPFVPGREAAGTVEAVATDVHDLAVGDRVAILAGGTYAESTVVERRLVARLPAGVTTHDAAACFLQGMTAAYLTTDAYPVQPGDHVLLPVPRPSPPRPDRRRRLPAGPAC